MVRDRVNGADFVETLSDLRDHLSPPEQPKIPGADQVPTSTVTFVVVFHVFAPDRVFAELHRLRFLYVLYSHDKTLQ